MTASAPARSMRAVDIHVDDQLQRVHVTICGDAAGPQVWNAVCDVFLKDPQRTGYDMLYDIRDYTGDVEAEHVKPIVAIYNSVRVPEAEGTRTAFLTHDPHFAFWAEAMTFQFPGRLHACFDNAADAETFLAVPRGRR
jgi:hypothetical protein